MIPKKIVGHNNDHVNASLDRATCFMHDYQSIITTQTLDDLKGCLAPLICEGFRLETLLRINTLMWSEVLVWIHGSTIIPSQNMLSFVT